eukprot:413152-Pyramimonas_sp.AAC.1
MTCGRPQTKRLSLLKGGFAACICGTGMEREHLPLRSLETASSQSHHPSPRRTPSSSPEECRDTRRSSPIRASSHNALGNTMRGPDKGL